MTGRATARVGAPQGSITRARYLSARRAFSSDAELAGFLDVHRSRVTRWKKGEQPDPIHGERLLRVDVVVSLLAGFLEDEVIPDWLHGINAHLHNRRPIDVLREGPLSEVVAAVEAAKSGSFA